MKAMVYDEELLERLTGSDKLRVLTEKRYNELLKKLDKLEKKLGIAVKALEWYAQPDESLAQETLKQIKDEKWS